MRLPPLCFPGYHADMDGVPPNRPTRRVRPDPWSGVALLRLSAAADPDRPLRSVAIPASWDEDAGAALAALAPGDGPALLPRLAEGWIGRAAERAQRLGHPYPDRLASTLRDLLLARRLGPGVATWRGGAEPLRMVLNLPAFLDAGGGFDHDGYAAAVATAVEALDALAQGKAERLSLGLADLSGWLAGLGLRYGEDGALAATAALGALTRGAADAASGVLAGRHGARAPIALFWPAPPPASPVPGLAEAARAALDAAAAAPGLRHAALLALSPADAAEALLGAEQGGLAPPCGPTRLVRQASGEVTDAPTRAALAAARRLAVDPLGPEVAALLAPVSAAARAATERALLPWLDAALPLAPAEAAPARARPAPRPATRQVAVRIGGIPVTLRITEAPDRRPTGLSISLGADPAGLRAVIEPLCRTVSDGWARRVPPDAFVACFAHAAIGPGGAVEGDPDIARASSVLDWAARRIGRDYLGRIDLLDPPTPAIVPRAAAPLLPLDLPAGPPLPRAPRRRAVRLSA
jgi:ribonucleoside-diphosphate reductase alpha chain